MEALYLTSYVGMFWGKEIGGEKISERKRKGTQKGRGRQRGKGENWKRSGGSDFKERNKNQT